MPNNASRGIVERSLPDITQRFSKCLGDWLAAVAVGLTGASAQADSADETRPAFFEQHIWPVLVEHCYECPRAESKTLKEKELSPASMADQRTLIRRAAYDLTGLPPV